MSKEDANLTAFKAYLQECEDNMCNPDVSSAFNAGWQAMGKLAEQPAQQQDAAALFREALAFGMAYGPALAADQWEEERELAVARLVSRLAAPQPEKRTWVGLTDEEIKELYGDDDNFRMTKKYVVAFARAIEAKLRSKNEDRN